MSAQGDKPEEQHDIYNFCRLRGELDAVTDGNGGKVMIQLFLTYFLYCKAMSRDWIQNTFNVYYLNVLFADSNTTNIMYTVYSTPFGVKTLWGSLSDAMPCLGYHKRFYIIWGVVVSIVCATMLAILYPEGQFSATDPAPMSVVIFVTCLFFGYDYGNATTDSLTQARYTELMKQMGKPVIVSFVWFLMNSCTLFSATGNWFIGEGSYKILLWPAVMFALPMLVPVSLNFLAEPPAKTFCSPDVSKVTKHKGCFMLAMFLAAGALVGSGLVLATADMEGSDISVLLPYYMFMGIAFIVASKFVLNPDIWGPAVYMFLCSALTMFFSGTLQGFYTFRNQAGLPLDVTDPCLDHPANSTLPCRSYCMADGPGFSTRYYQTVGQFLGAVAAVIAVMLFDQYIVKWNTRPAFWITCVFKMAATILEVMIIERWNHRLFGTVPGSIEGQYVDQLFFMVGAQAVIKIVDMLDFMPFNVLIGNMCPPNMEATIFAVLAGSQNFGTTIAYVFGGVYTKWMGVVFSQDFETCINPAVSWAGGMSAFGVVRIVAGIVMPAFTIPLTFVLLPDKPLMEKYEHPDDSAVELTGAQEGGFGAGGGAPSATGEAPVTEMSRGSQGIMAMATAGKSGSRLL